MQILPTLNVTIDNDNSNNSVTFGGGLPHGITVNEDTQYLFNFTIVNSADGGPENLTDVNITVPFEFAFLNGTNKSTTNSSGADSLYNSAYFTNSTIANVDKTLSWNGTKLNESINMNAGNASCCNVSAGTYLSANFSVATPGEYNITITYQFNNSATNNVSTIAVTVNDSTAPENVSSFALSYANLSGSALVFNITITDNGNFSLSNSLVPEIVNVNISVYNLSAFNDSSGLNASYNATNVTKFSNLASLWNFTFDTTTLTDGLYNITVTATDKGGNINVTNLTNVRIDNTAPTGSVSCTPSSVKAGATVTCTCTPADSGSGVNAGATVVTKNPSTANTGDFSSVCTFADNAGNVGTTSTTYTVTVSSGGGSFGGGGGGSTEFYKRTFSIIQDDFKNLGDITQKLAVKEKVRVKLDNVEHFIGIRELTATSILVEISSSHPVQATLAIGEETRADVDRDGFYDVYVKLRSIVDGKAELTIRYIQEKVPAGVIEDVPEDVVVGEEPPVEPDEVEKTNLVWLWVALAIIALIIVFWIYKRKTR